MSTGNLMKKTFIAQPVEWLLSSDSQKIVGITLSIQTLKHVLTPVLHGTLSDALPSQPVSPASPFKHVLSRVCTPPPHVTLHCRQGVQNDHDGQGCKTKNINILLNFLPNKICELFQT